MKTDVQLKDSYRMLEAFGGDPESPFFHAEESSSGKSVVVRAFVCLPDREETRREEALLSTLKIPALMPLIDAWQQGDYRFQAFPKPTAPLRTFMEKGLAPARSLEIARDLVSAFKEIHAQGLCCGTLSPDMVFVSEDGKPLIFHIGIPSSESIRSKADHRYITPEQARGQTPDHRSDFYRLGLLLYEMLTGEFPYQAENPVQMTMLHLHGPPAQLPTVFSRYQSLLDRLLAKDPTQRLTEAEEIRKEIKLALNEKEIRKLPKPSSAEMKTGTGPIGESAKAQAASTTSPRPVSPPMPAGRNLLFWISGALLLGAILGFSFPVIFFGPQNRGAGAPTGQMDEDLRKGLQAAAAYQREGHQEKALDQLKSLLPLYPESPELQNNLAALLASKGELESSSEILTNALKTDPCFATISDNLEVVRQEIARRTYSRALNLQIKEPLPSLRILGAADAQADGPQGQQPPSKANPPVEPQRVATVEDGPEAPEIHATKTSPATHPNTTPVDLTEYGPKEQEVIRSLQRWAQCWSDGDVEGYLGHYSQEYTPPDGLSLAEWQQQRRQRLNRPQWISVILEDFQITPTGPDTVQVKLLQEYRSNTYSDRSFKSLNLVREDGSWRIYLERTLGIIE